MSRNIRISLDCETLDTTNRAVVFDIGMRVSFEDDDERPIFEETFILPIQPQLDMRRSISYPTLKFHFDQGADAYARIFDETCEGDAADLAAYMRKFVRKLESAIDLAGTGGTYTIWTKGNFDLPIIQSLLEDLGIHVPWHFRRTSDLRTLLDLAGVDYKLIPRLTNETPHTGLGDARFQDRLYLIAIRALATGKVAGDTKEGAEKLPPPPTSPLSPERKLPFNTAPSTTTQST